MMLLRRDDTCTKLFTTTCLKIGEVSVSWCIWKRKTTCEKKAEVRDLAHYLGELAAGWW